MPGKSLYERFEKLTRKENDERLSHQVKPIKAKHLIIGRSRREIEIEAINYWGWSNTEDPSIFKNLKGERVLYIAFSDQAEDWPLGTTVYRGPNARDSRAHRFITRAVRFGRMKWGDPMEKRREPEKAISMEELERRLFGGRK